MKLNIPERRAKIVCTLGPSSETYENIRALAEAGMDVARLNFSHGTHEYHRNLIKLVRKVSDDLERPIAILQDLQGPKIRIGTFENKKIDLVEGENFTLTTRNVVGNEDIVSVSYKSFYKDVKPGDWVLLDDGKLKLIVETIKDEDVVCRVEHGGILQDKKGLNLPGSILSIACLTKKDEKDLKFGLDMNVDFVALSFVQKPEDVLHLKEKISVAGKSTPIVSKIEKPQAVAAIDRITDLTDVVMVARGDLGVEMLTEEVPQIQKEIIQMCNKKGVPVITATQMLESMIESPRPTRAEASDVANAVLDGSDAVMLSGETASGNYPVQAVSTMNRIVSLIEKKNLPRWDLKRLRPDDEYSGEYAIGYSACHSAELVKASAIICLTQTGFTAKMIGRFRPSIPIIALTYSKEPYHRLALYWGVTGFITNEFHRNIDEVVENLKRELLEKDIVLPKDTLVFTAGLPFSHRRKTNMLRIEKI